MLVSTLGDLKRHQILTQVERRDIDWSAWRAEGRDCFYIIPQRSIKE